MLLCLHSLKKKTQKVINFESVCVHSDNFKSFTVVNTLERSILVSVEVKGYPELRDTYPICQVVPPQQIAGFDVNFRCHSPRVYNQDVVFRINNLHALMFQVTANVRFVLLCVLFLHFFCLFLFFFVVLFTFLLCFFDTYFL